MSEKVPYKKALEMLYEKNAEIDALRTRLEDIRRAIHIMGENILLTGSYKEDITICENVTKEFQYLRSRLEGTQKMLDNTIDDLQNSAEKNLDFEAKNAALTKKLEQAYLCVATAEQTATEDTKQEPMMWVNSGTILGNFPKQTAQFAIKECQTLKAENAALKQKLEAVKDWVKLYDPDWNNDINKLKKILDGE